MNEQVDGALTNGAERLLTGAAAGEVLETAVAAAGGRLLGWRAVHVERRRERVTASYRAKVQWRGSGVPRDERFGAVTGTSLPPGVSVVGDGETSVGVWRLPFDPWLPGLAAAMDADAVAGMLSRFGTAGAWPRLRLRSYRPGRRAVVEANAGSTRLFLKVVRPDRVRDLHGRHRVVEAAGVPVPRSLGWTEDGVVALTALPGRTLRESLHRARGPWPPASALAGLLDQLPAELLALPPGAVGTASRVHHHAAMVGTVSAPLAERAHALAQAVAEQRVAGPTVPVHGDFYERQLITRDVRVHGMLDLDTAGPGERLDDLACLVGHLSVLALARPGRAGLVNGVVGGYLDEIDRGADPRQLRLRVCAVVLSLATGPHRVQEPGWPRLVRERVELAERWASDI